MKKIIALLFALSFTAHADTKISQLPLGTAASTATNDSFPYVDSVLSTTKRVKLSDLINVPTMSAALAGKQATGNYITALTGDVTASGPGSVAATVAKLQTYTLDLSTPPTNGQVLTYSTGSSKWTAQPAAVTGITTLNTLTATSQTFAVGTSGTDFAISSLTSTHTFNLPTSSAVNRGALSSADWSTFNAKVSATRAINTTSPLTGGGDLSADRTIAIPAADTNTDGYLTQTDWDTFNNKQAAGSYITALTGDATASGPGSAAITLATVNGDVGSFGSSTSIPSLTVNAKGLVTAASGNAVVAPAGTLTGTALNASVVTSSLTEVGTLTSGVWNASVIPILYGGTGQSTQTAAFDALAPTTTTGDLIVYGATDNVRLPVGTDGFVLTADSGEATGVKWAAPVAGGRTLIDVVFAGNAGATTACTSDPCTIVTNPGSGVSSVNWLGTGAYNINISGCSTTPVCTGAADPNFTAGFVVYNYQASSSTVVNVYVIDHTGTNSNSSVSVSCACTP